MEQSSSFLWLTGQYNGDKNRRNYLKSFYLFGNPFLGWIGNLFCTYRAKGKEWYHERSIPKISSITLIALLFPIAVMFGLKDDMIVQIPADVLRIA
jgi:ACR3 family arsenite transporter